MGMNWTDDQRRVIETRGRNLLVSAAAGSGKTAVLVERIIRLITDGENPLDIDRLLVMTFTNAAASEMRERIGQALDRLLEVTPENQHLQRQSVLVHHAQITTIDSFCLSLIREHFNLLDIDPAFRIGDEGELLLMQGDVMKELLEDYYEAGDEAFGRFVDTYATGKTDSPVEDYILQVYRFAQSNPWPKRWIEDCRRELTVLTPEELMQTHWMKFLLSDAKLQLLELKNQLLEALEICREESGPLAYEPMIMEDIQLLEGLIQSCGSYGSLNRGLKAVSWSRLASIRSKEIDPEKKEYVSSARNRMKKAVTKLTEEYGFETEQEVLNGIAGTREVIDMLLTLAQEFGQRYQDAKKEKNMVDFNDMEHFALDILVQFENGEEVYSPVADELSQTYQEILVDEYQDSNYVQETLIRCLSAERFGRPDVFMVGDVKQSIYKFRLARPELFMDKYLSYTKEDSPRQKIELHQNFRSRASVLDSINSVFYKIMTKNLGNIHYDEEAALYPGAEFAQTELPSGTNTELLMVNTSGELLKQLDDDSADFTSREIEAKLVAGKIRQMTDPEKGLYVWDSKKGEYRIAQYRDMVILLRSVSGWTEVFLNILMNEGIPAYAQSRTGYFNTIEVETILSLLTVIDNPMQDIPLAAVMKSPIANITDEELAVMVAAYKKTADKGQDRGLYGAWSAYRNSVSEGPLWEKLGRLENMLEEFRRLASYVTIHELLYAVYKQTGYYHYVSAMPGGDARRANLDMLVEKASAYEKTSYKGLFHFIRYIERLKKYHTDFGEASTLGEHENLVRIMSIHKSKGLEFPIVFLAGMGKLFNKQDVRGKILIDPDLGIGSDYLDLELRLKSPTLKKNVLKRRTNLENLGEELRVLYVAMTRAKEKLLMTATDRSLDKKLEKWRQIPLVNGQIPFTILSTASSYLDWLLMSMASPSPKHIEAVEIPVRDLVDEEVVLQVKKKLSKKELLDFDTEKTYDKAYREKLEKWLNYEYPHKADITLHTKISVSELKKQGQLVDEEETDFLPTVPKFLVEDGEQEGGAYRGSAYHRVMYLLDFSHIESLSDVKKALTLMEEEETVTKESLKLVKPGVIWKFLKSGLGQRMKKAQQEKRLYKERQFVIGIPAREMEVGDSGELVLIQGIIDAYFVEDGQLVLMDYKTDKVNPGQEQELVQRYQAQLDYYQKALEQMLGNKVKEKLIYSLALQKEISLL